MCKAGLLLKVNKADMVYLMSGEDITGFILDLKGRQLQGQTSQRSVNFDCNNFMVILSKLWHQS